MFSKRPNKVLGRGSRRLLQTLIPNQKISKDAVASAPTHELLQAINFVRQPRSGLVNWLPLGLRTLRKVETIIHNRMVHDAEAQEVSLSSLSSKSLWETTGRWSNSELFKLKDAKKSNYCLTATCEEDITDLMKEFIMSYKNLPILTYQITRKYRDELRPRGGLLRAREFIMKDAYSFSSNKEEALKMFEKINEVYKKIFTDLNIPFVSAWADSGDIGGDLSKEFHYIHESGEDTLFNCDHCDEYFNQEKCESLPKENEEWLGDVDVKYLMNKGHDTLMCYYYPKGRTLNWNLMLASVEGDIDTDLKDHENNKIIKLYQEKNADLMFAKILRVMDIRLNSKSNFPDFPFKNYLKNNFGQIDNVSLVNAETAEICGSCEKGTLHAKKGIEIGHTFHLGTKYSKPFKMNFLDNKNKSSLVEMGCYGIGVSRLVGAIAEVTRDSEGFKWPACIAPYKVSLITPITKQEDNVDQENVKKVFQLLNKSSQLKNEILHSFDPKLGLGAQTALSRQIGIPLSIIVGPRMWPNLEIEVRAKRWNSSETWKQCFEQNTAAWNWTYTEPTELKPEKHIVSHQHIEKLVNCLLKDF